MKKRRVLTLLLALSMAVGSNGMTVLAAGNGGTGYAVMAADEGQSGLTGEAGTTENGEVVSGGNIEEDTSTEGETADKPDGGDGVSAGENGEETANPGENADGESNSGDSSGDGDSAGENAGNGDQTGENTDGSGSVSENNGDTGNEGSVSENTDASDGSATEEENPDEVTEGGEGQETEEEKPTEEELEKEELPKAEADAVRMVTFTDDTGMSITYDAARAAGYQYTVVNGVLTGVKTTDAEGNETAVSGNVILEQPGEEDAYEPYSKIAAGVFQGNTDITYVKLPSGVTEIEAEAFKGCTALQGIYLPSQITAIGDGTFEGCAQLTQLAIPKNIKTIGARAFYQDTKLFMVHMKDADYSQLETIGNQAFYECDKLSKFCSDESFLLPDSIKTIGEEAFYGCSLIPDVLMGDGIESLGDRAFMNCSSVRAAVISAGLSAIGTSAFEGCTRLGSLVIRDKYYMIKLVIGTSAFKGCYGLGSIELPERVSEVRADAFAGCSGLARVYVGSQSTLLEDNAFPENDGMYLVGTADDCSAKDYVDKHKDKLKFININNSKDTAEKKYIYQKTFTGDNTEAVVMTVSTTPTGADIVYNDKNEAKKEGVKAATLLYVVFDAVKLKDAHIELVEGSLKCNGEPLDKKDGFYCFYMPVGGAFLTAEFVSTQSSKKIYGLADNVTVELSNGAVVSNGILSGELKVGQTTKMFLVSNHIEDEKRDESIIPASKIKYWLPNSGDKKYVSVSSDGTVKAVAEGSAVVCATVTGGNGVEINKQVRIDVSTEDVASIRLKVNDCPKYVEVQENDEVQIAHIDSNRVDRDYTFNLKATAYDQYDDDMAVALKWTTSDSKVAKLSKTSTTAASSVNTITIPKDTDGEATITVTATNKDNTKVTQQFVVSVRDAKPRLGSQAITINPNKTEGALLEVIGAYSEQIKTVQFWDGSQNFESQDFILTKDESSSTATISRYYVTARAGLENKSYKVRVKINGSDSNMQELKITVKATAPNPKAAFKKGQKKIDLFQANDETEVKMVISNLGKEKLSSCKLEPLSAQGDSTYADDKLFTDNFAASLSESEANTVVIRQISDSMFYTSKKKPAVTGYLVLRCEGYSDKIEKKIKITVPTRTVTPAYVLSKTSDTYNALGGEQTVRLNLLEKKTKKKVELSAAEFDKPQVLADSVTSVPDSSCIINDAGELQFKITDPGMGGKVKIRLHKKDWADGKTLTFTYTIKSTTANPKISLKGSTVTLNAEFPDAVASFALAPNQNGTALAEKQVFDYNHSAQNSEEYAKITVTCGAEGGEVRITDRSIKAGTYKFSCTVAGKYGQTFNKVVLSVKVKHTLPTAVVKGSIALNTLAGGRESSELTFTPKNLSEGYELDVAKTLQTVTCKTKNYETLADRFNWSIKPVDDPKAKTQAYRLQAQLKENAGSIGNGTYKFSITPKYKDGQAGHEIVAKATSFSVKIHSGIISVKLTAKGKVNLLDRLTQSSEYKTTNSIVYTPSFKNVKAKIPNSASQEEEVVKIFDADGAAPTWDGQQSERFEIESLDGKLYVIPKKGAVLKNNTTYKVKIWVKLDNYEFTTPYGGGTWVNGGNIIKIKTAQVLPKVTTDVSTVNLYLSNKDYTATFTVSPKAGSVGSISGISFDEKDEKANASFKALTVKPASDDTSGGNTGSGTGSGEGSGTGSGEGGGTGSGEGSGTGSGESGGTGSGEGSGTGSGESGGTGSGEGGGTGSDEGGEGSGTGSGEGSGTGSGESGGTGSDEGSGTGSGEGGGTGSDEGSGTGSGESGSTGSGEGSGTGSGESGGTGSGEGGEGSGTGSGGTGSGEGSGTGSSEGGEGSGAESGESGGTGSGDSTGGTEGGEGGNLGGEQSGTTSPSAAAAFAAIATAAVTPTGDYTVEKLENGSLKVTLKLKSTVAYACNSTNTVKMYVEFEGQGENTPGTAIKMKVKINK